MAKIRVNFEEKLSPIHTIDFSSHLAIAEQHVLGRLQMSFFCHTVTSRPLAAETYLGVAVTVKTETQPQLVRYESSENGDSHRLLQQDFLADLKCFTFFDAHLVERTPYKNSRE